MIKQIMQDWMNEPNHCLSTIDSRAKHLDADALALRTVENVLLNVKKSKTTRTKLAASDFTRFKDASANIAEICRSLVELENALNSKHLLKHDLNIVHRHSDCIQATVLGRTAMLTGVST